MSEDKSVGRGASGREALKRTMFRARFATPRLSPEKVERQSRITLLAWNRLGGDAAIAFLNTYNLALEGRPLDLAVASEAGYEIVEHAISAKSIGD